MERAARPVTIRLWGDLRVIGGDGLPIEIASRKARACIALLAGAGDGRVSRERLAGMLWGDRSGEQARANLRQLLYELKPLSQPEAAVLGFDRQSVWLEPACEVEFAAIARQGALQMAASLPDHGVPLLGDLDGISEEFDDWLIALRASAEIALRRCVQQRVQDALTAGDAAGARMLVDAWMRRDATDETIAQLGLRADAALGDVAGMQRRTRHLAAALATELGVKPTTATLMLAQDLGGASGAVPASKPQATIETSAAVAIETSSYARRIRLGVCVAALLIAALAVAFVRMRHDDPAARAARDEATGMAAQARGLTHGRTLAGYVQAVALARRAVARDPDYAPGWAELAVATWLRSQTGLALLDVSAARDARAEAERYVERSLSLDPQSSRALALRGLMLGDSAEAGTALRRAAALADDSETLLWLSNWLDGAGLEQEALSVLRRATEIDPLWDRSVRAYVHESDYLGEHEAADRMLERFAASSPNPYAVAALRMESATSRGDLVVAAQQGREALEHAPDNPWIEMLGIIDIAAAIGDAEAIRRLTARSRELAVGAVALLDSRQVVARVESAPVAWLDRCAYCEEEARALLRAGRPELLLAAIEQRAGDPFENALRFGGDHIGGAALHIVALRAVHRDADAARVLAAIRARLDRRHGRDFNTGMESAVTLALEGRDEDAVRELDGAIDKGWRGQTAHWAVDPAEEPAFAALRERADFARVRARLAGEREQVRAQVVAILAGIPAPIVSTRGDGDDS